MSNKNEFRQSLNLPQTEFPMRANLPQREPNWVQRWLDEDIYGKLRSKRKDAEKFILHLGPPYANGQMHMGHTLTYTLKDFIVRAKGFAGYDSPYIPGWDCHGLPIEWKVEQQLREEGKTKYDLSTKELRDRCRAYAEKWIGVQQNDWQRMGALADWENHYRTMNFANEAEIVRQLGKLAVEGYLYRGYKPVQWSPTEETALAEAEIEYDDNHESLSVYVKYPVHGKENEYVTIWTTTTWTLPSSLAVVYGDEIAYQLLEVVEKHPKAAVEIGAKLWVATDLVDEFKKMCGIEAANVVAEQKGDGFAGWMLSHPFFERDIPMFHAEHTTTEQGTGFVHTAPMHGMEDYQVGLEHGLETTCHVDGAGNYDDWFPELNRTGVTLTGMNVLEKKTHEAIIAEATAAGNLLRWYKYAHKYPISWRSKQPLIFRTTPQWFVALDNQQNLRAESLKAIDTVQWVPGYGRNRIYGMIENRPDWCISRQRKWGVPLAMFYDTKNQQLVTDQAIFNHIANLMEQEGIDAWDSRLERGRLAELLPNGWLEANNLSLDDLEPQTDILDVWFDSGTTHAHVVRNNPLLARNDGKRPADVYFEGSDQHRGWFHSSLLASVANYGDAPYETVLTHGYVVDDKGKKYSKSLGNGKDPKELYDVYGMDVLRLWVAAADYTTDISMSDTVMDNVSEGYRKFRNTFRYLIGNLFDFNAEQAVAYADLPELEQYILHRLREVTSEVQEAYDTFQFHKVYRALYDFCVQELSNLYFDVRKDSLYCDAAVETDATAEQYHRRKSCQTVLHHLLNSLTTYLGPILVFTTDEAWREYYGADQCVHLETFYQPAEARQWQQDDAFADKWQAILQARDEVNQELEGLRTGGQLKTNNQAKVKTSATVNQALLQEVLMVAQLEVGAAATEVAIAGEMEKCPRCWTYHDHLTSNGVCDRCDAALTTIEQRDEQAA